MTKGTYPHLQFLSEHEATTQPLLAHVTDEGYQIAHSIPRDSTSWHKGHILSCIWILPKQCSIQSLYDNVVVIRNILLNDES